jgi:hypothetical protein
VIRRVPIPRTSYRWEKKAKPSNVLRYETIMEGAVRVYPDGREVCNDNAAGRREYARRIEVMCQRQNFRCCLCPERIHPANATFEHEKPRRMAAAFRNDAIVDAEGNPVNGAAHWACNRKKGSRRIN